MEGFYFVTATTGCNRHSTGKKDDDEHDYERRTGYSAHIRVSHGIRILTFASAESVHNETIF